VYGSENGKQGTGQISRIETPGSEGRPGIKLTNRYLSATRTQPPKNQESIFDLSLDSTSDVPDLLFLSHLKVSSTLRKKYGTG
jgi:hypothetical protein